MLGLEASDDERGGDADPDVAGSDPDFDELGDLVNRADDRTGGGGRATSEPAKSGGSRSKKKRGENEVESRHCLRSSGNSSSGSTYAE